MNSYKFVFGPVPSRRLGMSLGINNIPYKTCTYSCVYCQLGRTNNMSLERKCFYDYEKIADEVIRAVRDLGEKVDYVTFVPDGEPTLDKCIGKEIERIKSETNAKVAVITNSSLLFYEDVRNDIERADYISVKVDAVDEKTWRMYNRPNGRLELGKILEGIEKLSKSFRGKLTSETMISWNLNDSESSFENVGKFLSRLRLFKAYISVPIRPPAESFVLPPDERSLVMAYDIFSGYLGKERVELLNMPEPPRFEGMGDPKEWLLNVTSVHPLRYEYAIKGLSSIAEEPEKIIEDLLEREEIRKVSYGNSTFIVRSFRKASGK